MMLQNIPQQRLLLYILFAGLIPLFLAMFWFMNSTSSLNDLETSILLVDQLAATRERKQATNIAVRNNFRDADHFYIDKNLENLDFLEPETESLQAVVKNKNFPDDENIKKRLDFLLGASNNLEFTEGNVQTTPMFQEVVESLAHPVEVNVNDIQAILAKVEGIKIGDKEPSPNRPQLIIIEFKLDKKQTNEKNQVYQLNMKLLKREYT